MQKNDESNGDERQRLLAQVLEEVRVSSKNGAASVLGNSRQDDLADISSETVEEYVGRVECPKQGNDHIRNHRSWAFKVGKTKALHQVKLEAKFDALNPEQELATTDAITWRPDPASKREIADAFPELIDLFLSRVVKRLNPRDRALFERYYYDKWSEEQLAEAFGISRKSVRQRWGRLLLKLRANLLRELRGWDRGEQLFGEAFRDPKSLLGLLCVIAVFVRHGIDAIRDLVDSLTFE